MSILKFNGKILKNNGNVLINRPGSYFYTFANIAERLLDMTFEKCAIFVRHSVRLSTQWGPEVHLTDLGISYAMQAGMVLMDIPDEFDYYSTDMVRTKETAMYISKGREDGKVETTGDVLPMNNMPNPEYIKDQTRYNEYSQQYGYNNLWRKYMYREQDFSDAFYDITDVSQAFETAVLTNITKKYNIIVSHDQNVMPFMADRGVVRSPGSIPDFRPNKWLNYLTGTVMIKFAGSDTPRYLPITGLGTGFN